MPGSRPAPRRSRRALPAPGANPELDRALRNASLLVDGRERGPTTSQELLAAARADYGRLLGALYSEGHFGGIDQHPWSTGARRRRLSPLDPPRHDQQDRRSGSSRGRLHLRRGARSRPLAPETELPEEFALGQPARAPAYPRRRRGRGRGLAPGRSRQGRVAGDERIVARHAAHRIDATVADRSRAPLVRFGRSAPRRRRRPGAAGAPAPDRGLARGPHLRPRACWNAPPSASAPHRHVPLGRADRGRDAGAGRHAGHHRAASASEAPRRFGFGAEISTVEGLTLSRVLAAPQPASAAPSGCASTARSAGIGGGTGGIDYSFDPTSGGRRRSSPTPTSTSTAGSNG